MSISELFSGADSSDPAFVPNSALDPSIATARAQADGFRQMLGVDSYSGAPPNLFGFRSDDADLKRFMLARFSRPRVDTPPEDVYLLRDAYVSDLPVVFTRDRQIFAPSATDHSKPPTFESVTKRLGNAVPEIDGRAVFIFKTGIRNYGHILVEMLPRLETVALLVEEPTKLLVPPRLGLPLAELRWVVDTLYPGKFVVTPMTSKVIKVRELLYPGPISAHSERKSKTLLRFADRLSSAVPDSGRFRQTRLYVSREGIRNRRLINEGEIRRCFEQQGFTVVSPQRLNLADQIDLFRSAAFIAGPFGAGLTNIVFAPPQASVLMLTGHFRDFFFWDLACLRGQSFNWYFGEPLRAAIPSDVYAAYRLPVKPIQDVIELLADIGWPVASPHPQKWRIFGQGPGRDWSMPKWRRRT